MQKLLILLAVLVALPLQTEARTRKKIITQTGIFSADSLMIRAENDFDIGNFEAVIEELDGNISSSWGSDQKVKAYRLLSLSSMYLDDNVQAKKFATRLLDEDAFYNAYDDSPKFQDLLQSIKGAETKITTASSQSEGVEESPVPITVISRQMIDNSGAQTLQDLLCLYVPGMSRMGGIESNIGMRSVYGNMQEDILIMLDGHRLNSGATNAESPDYRTSLDKIDHIEVLRGPASSLYGNVALTAVVNIITRTGSSVHGAQLNALAGMHNQYGGGFLFGNGNRQSDLLAWGTVYNSRGERYKASSQINERYIGGYNSKPAFDFGVKARWKDFSASVTGQHCKLVPFINLVSSGRLYSYNSYGGDNGSKPGTSRTTINANLDYTHRWNKFTLCGTAYFNTERAEIYNVMGDTVNKEIGGYMLWMLTGIKSSSAPSQGVWESLSWENYTYGVNVNGNMDYKIGKNGANHGSVLFGAQFDYFMMSGSKFQLGTNYNQVYASNNQGLNISNEWSLSPYVQLKHYFGRHFIFNGGLRYDHKARYDKTAANAVSPRATVIWLPSDDRLSVKFGYARSFVDAPYIYRASNVSVLQGKYLRPQYLNSLQLSGMYKMKSWKTNFEVNIFYNMARDLVRFNINSLKKAQFGGGDTFTNSGILDLIGVEMVAEYNNEGRLYGNFNMTIQHPTRMSAINVIDGGNVNNESLMMMNATCAGHIWGNKRVGSFSLRGNVHFQTANDVVIVQIDNLFKNMLPKLGLTGEALTTRHQKANAQLNLGVDWKWKSYLKVSCDVYNVTNARYGIGTTMTNPTSTQGTRFVGRVQVNF